jgi:hypothetical protein
LNQTDGEVGFVALVVVADGNAAVVAENGGFVVVTIPIDVVETGSDPPTSGFDVADFDGWTGFRRDGQADCNEDALGFLGGDGLVFAHDDDKMQQDATGVNRKKQTISRGILCPAK